MVGEISLRRTAIRCAWILPVLALAGWAWNSNPINLRDRLFPKHLAEVYPGLLYRSGQIDARLIEDTLRDLGVEVIIDLAADRGSPEQELERSIADRLGVEYHPFVLGGSGTGEVEAYVDAVATIARAIEASRPVLVHCRAGDRRTGGVIATYQLLVRGDPPERAFEELRRFARRSVQDSRLAEYLRIHLGEIAKRLAERGVPLRAPSGALAAIDGLFEEDLLGDG